MVRNGPSSPRRRNRPAAPTSTATTRSRPSISSRLTSLTRMTLRPSMSTICLSSRSRLEQDLVLALLELADVDGAGRGAARRASSNVSHVVPRQEDVAPVGARDETGDRRIAVTDGHDEIGDGAERLAGRVAYRQADALAEEAHGWPPGRGRVEPAPVAGPGHRAGNRSASGQDPGAAGETAGGARSGLHVGSNPRAVLNAPNPGVRTGAFRTVFPCCGTVNRGRRHESKGPGRATRALRQSGSRIWSRPSAPRTRSIRGSEVRAVMVRNVAPAGRAGARPCQCVVLTPPRTSRRRSRWDRPGWGSRRSCPGGPHAGRPACGSRAGPRPPSRRRPAACPPSPRGSP